MADLSSVAVLFIVSLYTVSAQAPSAIACSRHYFHGEGVLESYNFPFNYRDRINCDYFIGLDNYPPDAIKQVCFTFHRFETEAAYDYFIFHLGGIKCQYDNKGTLHLPVHDAACPLDVWADNMCWTTTENYFRVQFQSDQAVNRRGFYATYESSIRNQSQDVYKSESPQQKINGIETNAQHILFPSEEQRSSINSSCHVGDQWTCFNRRCVHQDALCNKVNNCGDVSDETYAHARCADSDNGGPNIRACDFQDKSSCQLDGFGNGWVLDGGSLHSDKGPYSDHTTGNRMGGFFTRTKFWAAKDRATPDVTLFDLTKYYDPNKAYCLSFFYHMMGRDVGRLQVDLQLLGSYTIQSVWSRVGNYSNRWLRAEIPIQAKDLSGYAYTKIKATRGGDIYTQLALDDFYISPGSCRGEDVSCNFEIGTCGWEVTEGLIRRTPHVSHNGPRTDKSSEDGTGFYLMWQSDVTNSSQTLTSPVITTFSEQSTKGCLVFWHYNRPLPSGPPRRPLLTIKKMFNNRSMSIFYQLTNQIDDWTFKMLDLTDNRAFQLVFEWKSVPSDDIRVVAIDQISLLPLQCNQLDLTSCSPLEYRCHTGECIPVSRACDGSRECADGSDELPEACCTLSACPEEMFCCRNSRCVDSNWVCDGDNDCNDWSDEDHCDATCPENRFQCGNDGRCINRKYLCNGNNDCQDGSDERNCSGLPYVSPAVMAVVVVLGMILLVLVFVKVGLAVRSGTCRLSFLRRRRYDEEESGETPPSPDPALYQRPPEYSEAVSNPVYLPNRQTDGDKSDEDKPPGYDRVIKGEFVQLQSASARELDILRNQLRTVTSETPNSVDGEQARPYVLAFDNTAFDGDIGSIDRPSSSRAVINLAGSGDIGGVADSHYFLHPGEENSPPPYVSRPPSRQNSGRKSSSRRIRRHSDGMLSQNTEPRDIVVGDPRSVVPGQHLLKMEARIMRQDRNFAARRSQTKTGSSRVVSAPSGYNNSSRESQVNDDVALNRQQSWTTV